MSTFRASYEGIGKMLNCLEMQAAMLALAEKVKARAEATAPDAPPYGVGYKYEFSVDSGAHGGLKKDRAYGRVKNSSDHAIYVEFGNGTESGARHRTLGKALGAVRA